MPRWALTPCASQPSRSWVGRRLWWKLPVPLIALTKSASGGSMAIFEEAGLPTVNGAFVSLANSIERLPLALTTYWRSPIRDQTVMMLRNASACMSAPTDRASS